MELDLRTVGEVPVVASRTLIQREAGEAEAGVNFHTVDGELVAVHPADEVRRADRLFPIKPDDPDWVLGPVETARVKALVDPP